MFPCRCRKCWARKTFKKHPDAYVMRHHVTCPVCGADDMRVDAYRMTKEHKRVLCKCDGLPYPHRAGSSIWCREHPTGPTEQEYYEQYGLT